MSRSITKTLVGVLLAVFASAMLTVPADATTGYFSHGYGVKYKGIAGAGSALALSSLAAANNPGAMAFIGTRYDFNLGMFSPDRSYTVTGNPTGAQGTFGLMPGKVESESKYFVIPALGANWTLREDQVFLGVSAYGNGGMNTDYPTATFGGTQPTGVDLQQMFIAPTISVKMEEIHGLGFTPIVAYQRFEAKGMQAFGMFSTDDTKLTNNGYANSWGFGFRLGYLGQLHEKASIGASYQSKIWMSELDEYAGLFAEKGDFDIPSTWVVGLGLFPKENIKIAIDLQQIVYEDVKAVSNPMMPNLQNAIMGDANYLLGAPEGAGFGWQNIFVIKGGVEWQSSPNWAWRAGYSYNEQPIPETEVMFNILAPGVQQHHITIGLSTIVKDRHELSFSGMYSPSNSVTGPNPLDAPGAQTIEIEMKQFELVVGYSFF